MLNNRRSLVSLVAIAAVSLAVLISGCNDDNTEKSIEQAGSDIKRVVEDGKNALRTVAEEVNDAVY